MTQNGRYMLVEKKKKNILKTKSDFIYFTDTPTLKDKYTVRSGYNKSFIVLKFWSILHWSKTLFELSFYA